MKKIPISKATNAQLRQFATRSLQLELPPIANDKQILAKMQAAAYDKDFITLSDDDAPAPSPEADEAQQQQVQEAKPIARRVQGGRGEKDPKVEITIGFGSLPGGRDPVPVSVNGRAVVIQRGMRVAIPYRYFLALNLAKNADASQPDLSKAINYAEVSNYPITVHQETFPTQAEIDDWMERTKDIETV